MGRYSYFQLQLSDHIQKRTTFKPLLYPLVKYVPTFSVNQKVIREVQSSWTADTNHAVVLLSKDTVRVQRNWSLIPCMFMHAWPIKLILMHVPVDLVLRGACSAPLCSLTGHMLPRHWLATLTRAYRTWHDPALMHTHYTPGWEKGRSTQRPPSALLPSLLLS